MSETPQAQATAPKDSDVTATAQGQDQPEHPLSETPQAQATAPKDSDVTATAQGQDQPVLDPEVVGKRQQRAGLQVQEFVASFAKKSGPAYHPIFEKFESEHVSQFLTQAREEDREERQFRGGNRWFRLGYVGSSVGVFLFLTLFLLPDHSALYLELLKVLGAFGAGIAGGYGLRAYQERRPGR